MTSANRPPDDRTREQLLDDLAESQRRLDESNRGVESLHAEIADKNDSLRRTNDVKLRVVANVSHEFRTPLHTILGLSKLLLDASDGPLTDEQTKQIKFIRNAAEELSDLVNDLLDLSKAESGKLALRAGHFSLPEMFSAMRGMLRPLIPADGNVRLALDDPPDVSLDTDRTKVVQVLRNLIVNALKFTEQGEVRLTATLLGDRGKGSETVRFVVKDTGIGISPEHHDAIFEEFSQIEGPAHKQNRGAGLGLALSRRLADALGGRLRVESELGKGASFIFDVPVIHPEVKELQAIAARPIDPSMAPVLVVEDDRKTIFIYEKFLSLAGFQVVPARTIDEARRLVKTFRPAAVVLDVMLEGETSWDFLADLKRDPETQDLPVLVVTVTNKEQKARALGADEFWLKPVSHDRLLRKLRTIAKPGIATRLLVIDDDDKARYLLKKLLGDGPFVLEEAATGPEGVKLARETRPQLILLDFVLGDAMTAFDVLDELKADPRTRGIPVIVVTSHVLDADARARLSRETQAILSKESLSRELAMNRIRDALQKAGVGASASATTTASASASASATTTAPASAMNTNSAADGGHGSSGAGA